MTELGYGSDSIVVGCYLCDWEWRCAPDESPTSIIREHMTSEHNVKEEELPDQRTIDIDKVILELIPVLPEGCTREIGMLRELVSEFEVLREKREKLDVLVGCALRSLQHVKETKCRAGTMSGPTWGKVGQVFGLGCTSSIELCRNYGVDPHYDCDTEEAGE